MVTHQQWFKVGAGIAMTVTAALAYLAYKEGHEDDQMISTEGFDLRIDPETGELIKCPRKKLI